MGRKYTDNALTTLAIAINAAAQTLQVAAGKGNNFSAITGKGAPGSAVDHTVITMEDSSGNREEIKVEHRPVGSDILGSVGYPLVRGYNGTVARAWNPGDSVDCRWDASAAQDHEDKIAASGHGRAFGIKASTTAGLNYGYYGGSINADGAPTVIADGTVVLTANQTNYVERTPNGVVSVNIVGFSADKVPMQQVTTDATNITAVVDKRPAANAIIYGGIQKSLAAGGTIVLTADEARAPIIEFTGALPNNTTVEFPNVKRNWITRNNTTGNFTLTCKVNGQPGTQVGAGEAHLYGNGTDIRQVVSDALLTLQAQGGILNALSDYFYQGF